MKTIKIILVGLILISISITGCIEETQEETEDGSPTAVLEYERVFPTLPKDKVSFSAKTSSDPDGGELEYLWEFGDGETSTEKEITHQYYSTGAYHIKLTVTDEEGLTDLDEIPIIVEPVPVITMNISFVAQNITTNTTIFNITILDTEHHSVKIDDVGISDYSNLGGAIQIDPSLSEINPNIYFDVDDDGYISTGDYIIYSNWPLIDPVVNETYFEFGLVYLTHEPNLHYIGKATYYF